MYMRISKENRKQFEYYDVESNSILNQRRQIEDYMKKDASLKLFGEYIDDGYSGTNFDRPGFQKMMKDMMEGKINCVIVKDLSRFGRNYIETGKYLQVIFPNLKVRMIAIADLYDSEDVGYEKYSILLPLKNFINDSYCRDISIKVRSQLDSKRKNGECVAAFSIYGYKKMENQKNKWEADPYASEIVRQIFNLKLYGFSNKKIAKRLNQAGILSPREYKKARSYHFYGGFYGSSLSEWSPNTIKRILSDERYLGHMIQGKSEKINYKVNKVVLKEKSDWIVVKHMHAPLIAEHEFDVVQELLKYETRVREQKDLENDRKLQKEVFLFGKEKQIENYFFGILICGDCKKQMVKRIGRTQTSYICTTHNQGKGCTIHRIYEEVLRKMILYILRQFFIEYEEELENVYMEHIRKREKNSINHMENVKDLGGLKSYIMHYQNIRNKLETDYENEIVPREDYLYLHQNFTNKIENLKKKEKAQIQYWNLKMRKEAYQFLDCNNFCGKACADVFVKDRLLLAMLVKKIEVYEENRIRIYLYAKKDNRISSCCLI